jgi:hypothetical protein
LYPYHVVRCHERLKVIRIENVHIGCEIVLGLYELKFGPQSSVHLRQFSEPLLLNAIHFPFIIHLVSQSIRDLGLSLDLSLELYENLLLHLQFLLCIYE